MNYLTKVVFAAVALVSGSLHAADRIQVALVEGQDVSANPQIPKSPGPMLLQQLVNAKIGNSTRYAVPKAGPWDLQLNLLALETSAPNEVAYAFFVNAVSPKTGLSPITSMELRTCQLTAMESCAGEVMRALDTAASRLPH